MLRFLRRQRTPATEQPLDDVLVAEKTAAAAVSAAREAAQAWLERERTAIAAARDTAVSALAARAAADEASAREAAFAAAAKEIEAAETFAGVLSSLRDADLRPIVARHVASIIPGPEP
ncbi:MAG TPA: hypothetical protein VFV51_16435 [Vicinamibacterales bacterium]|nr:hypothetical protein [Vicinamibacterales bacterium]